MLDAEASAAAEPAAAEASSSETHATWVDVEAPDQPTSLQARLPPRRPPLRKDKPTPRKDTPQNSWRKSPQLSRRSSVGEPDADMPPLLGWFVDVLGPTTRPMPAKKPTRRHHRGITTRSDNSRPEWVDVPTNRAPLTGSTTGPISERASFSERVSSPPPTVFATAVRPAAVPNNRVTGSPTGRGSSSPERRIHVRQADMTTMIDYISHPSRAARE